MVPRIVILVARTGMRCGTRVQENLAGTETQTGFREVAIQFHASIVPYSGTVERGQGLDIAGKGAAKSVSKELKTEKVCAASFGPSWCLASGWPLILLPRDFLRCDSFRVAWAADLSREITTKRRIKQAFHSAESGQRRPGL